MKTAYAVIAMIIVGLSPALHAHTNLASSVPEDGSQTKAVSEIKLVFSAAVKLTAMKLNNTDGTEIALGSISGDLSDTHTVAVTETLVPGRYAASWRSISSDSHVVDGELRFIVTD